MGIVSIVRQQTTATKTAKPRKTRPYPKQVHPEVQPLTRSLKALLLALLLPLALLGGCATNNPRDPLEPMNRAIYGFNDGVDTAIIRPVAEGYRAILPAPVRTGVSNVFANINDVLIALNNLLQGKVVNAVSDVGRVLVNTTIGIGGIFDVATNIGLEKHNEDFGQTLGWWGIGDGPYLVIPIRGPSNLRDAVGRFVDQRIDPITYVRSMRLRNMLWGLRALNQRADLLDTSKILETAALDQYEFVRDAYLQRRRNLVYDGAPPREKDDGAMTDPPQRARAPRTPYPDAPEAGSTFLGSTILNTRADDWTPARAAMLESTATPLALAQLQPPQSPFGALPPVAVMPEATPAAPAVEPKADAAPQPAAAEETTPADN